MKTKNIITQIMTVVAAGLVAGVTSLTFSSCKKHTPTVKETNTKMLTSHQWKISTLKIDNTDQTSLYPGMTLTFTSDAYTSTNGTPVWPGSGTWTFSDDGLTITRNDGLVIAVSDISDNTLVLEFDWSKTTFSGGRQSSVQGHHVFTFIK